MNANQTATRLFTVLAAMASLFCVYFFILTPNLEPPLPRKKTQSQPTAQLVPQSPYTRFFPEEAWERTTGAENLCKSNNIVMIFQNFALDEEMKVRSDKCTILIAPGEKTFPTEETPGKPFNPVIISILEGAEIQFAAEDGKIDPRPLGGKLNGPVTINYKASVKDQLMDCFLTTSDLVCDMVSVQTPKPVHFMLGPLSGDGSQLKILFETDSGDRTVFSGVQSIQLAHLNQISLRVTPFLLHQLNLKASPEMQDRMLPLFGPRLEIPVTLKCSGPMLYDVANGSVTFHQNVEIAIHYANAPADTLVCDELTLRLTPEIKNRFLGNAPEAETGTAENAATPMASENASSPENANSQSPNAENSGPASENPDSLMEQLPLESIQAKQNVLLNLPTFNCRAEAETLEFHVANQMLQLSGSQQTAIHFAQHEFHANSISYTFPPARDQMLGTIHVSGNGWFRTYFQNSQTSGTNIPLTMSWRQELTSSHQEKGRYRILASGGVEFDSPGFGKLSADKIQTILRPRTREDEQNQQQLAFQLHASLEASQKNASTGSMNLLPESLTAIGSIHLSTEQEYARLSADLEQIHLQFTIPAKAPEGLLPATKKKAGTSPALFAQPASSSTAAKSSVPPRDFRLQANSLQSEIYLLPGKDSFFISQLFLEGKSGQELSIREELPFGNSEQALSLKAQKIALHDLLPQTLQCEIVGSPAILAGLGIRLESSKIALNCAANRIDVNDAGKMHVYYRKKLDPKLNYSTLLETTIQWEQNLFFNGQVISVQDHVQIATPSTTLQAEKIQALLTEKILLSDPPKIEKTDQQQMLDFFADISAEQNVLLKHQNFNQQNQLTDIFTVKTSFASFQPGSMALNVSGRGTLRLSHFGTVGQMEQNESDAPSEKTQSAPEWFQVFLEYFGGIQGNLADGEFSINQGIAAIACPIPNEKYELPQVRLEPREIPEKGFQFSCDQIFINQIPTFQHGGFQLQNQNDLKLEFQAEGNVHVENSVYSVDGEKLKYSQEKNFCSISGTPGMPVRITQQEFAGGRRNEMEAGTVEINLKTMKFNMDQVMINGAF